MELKLLKRYLIKEHRNHVWQFQFHQCQYQEERQRNPSRNCYRLQEISWRLRWPPHRLRTITNFKVIFCVLRNWRDCLWSACSLRRLLFDRDVEFLCKRQEYPFSSSTTRMRRLGAEAVSGEKLGNFIARFSDFSCKPPRLLFLEQQGEFQFESGSPRACLKQDKDHRQKL